MCIQIRQLLLGLSDLGLHRLTKRLLKQFSRQQKQTILDVIGALRINVSTKQEGVFSQSMAYNVNPLWLSLSF